MGDQTTLQLLPERGPRGKALMHFDQLCWVASQLRGKLEWSCFPSRVIQQTQRQYVSEENCTDETRKLPFHWGRFCLFITRES